MKNEYVQMAKQARKAADRVTKETIRRTQKLLEESTEELAKKLSEQTRGTLKERHLQELMQSFKEKQKELNREIKAAVKEGIEKGAQAGTSTQSFLGEMIPDIEISKSFKSMLANVNDGVVKSIVQGDLYSDHRTLSERIWNITSEFGAKVQDVVAKGMLKQKSAAELASDIRTFVKPPERRSLSWRGSYEGYKSYYANWNAKRLARTTINHSYQTATIKAAKNNPYVTGILWRTSGSHRVCDLCNSRNGKIFPVEDVPLDHPNGMCSMIPNIEKSLEDIAKELSAWTEGEKNERLDSWYKELVSTESSKTSIDDNKNKKVDKLKEYKNVDSKLEGELQKRSDKAWENDLLFSEQNALQEYSYTSFGITNRYLRNALYSDDDIVLKGTAERIKELDRLLSRNKLGDDLVLHRGVSYKEFEEWKKSGIINTYKSTSIDPTVTYTFDSVYKIKINAPSETQGFYLGKYSEIPSEKEFLLHRGQKYRILKIEDTVMEVEFYA